jgi:putative membrane-bound dehydrogenase-like protein
MATFMYGFAWKNLMRSKLIVPFFLAMTNPWCESLLNAQERKENTQNESIPFLTPAEAVSRMKVPDGFRVEIFAHEPEVQQPISLTTDTRGRLWIAECHTYAESSVNFDLTQSDRIVILEDTDGDGRSDRRKVFADGLHKLTSVEVGFGGVWALAAPHLLFFPDANQDDVPDGKAVVLLDGWDADSVRHNIVNGLKWGPDGWLYGRHGILATSNVGVPGASDSQRTPINCGVWRYHPTRKIFEVVAHGTTNPWGFDFNEKGEMFLINTVIGHLWHVVPNSHYRRMYGTHFNPYIFQVMEQTADHFHWDTEQVWHEVNKLGVTDGTSAAGGGHAHSGLMIYQGSNWPEEYRGKAFTVNLHGKRLNSDRLERESAGFVGKHEPDFLFAADPWFRAVDLISGADGAVYLADWSDIGECHENDGVHRSSGRIYKISYGKNTAKAVPNLAEADDDQLVAFIDHEDDWWARQSRRLLHERATSLRLKGSTADLLKKRYEKASNAQSKLHVMWGLEAIGETHESWLLEQLRDPDESVRSWVVRLLADHGEFSDRCRSALQKLAESEKSGLVQLYLASTLPRFPLVERMNLATAISQHSEFSDDRMLPLLVWYGIEPAVAHLPDQAAEKWAGLGFPLLRRFVARRLVLEIDHQPRAIETMLKAAATSKNREPISDLLAGMSEAIKGWSKATQPKEWPALIARIELEQDDGLSGVAREIAVVFGSGKAIDELRSIIVDGTTDVSTRQQALRTLVTARADGIGELLNGLLDDRDLIVDAIRGLESFDLPQTPKRILQRWPKLNAEGRMFAVSTLTSRVGYANELLDALAENKIERHDITAFHARQILNLGDELLSQKLSKDWGDVRATAEDKRRIAESLKSQLNEETLGQAQLSDGRALFNASCANCHVLFGNGKSIGPDLTGGNRRNLDYLLENILDPSASVAADFRMTIFEMADGRVVSGVIVDRTEKTLTIQTPTDQVNLAIDEITEQTLSQQSLMPDGLLQNTSPDQVRDLLAYLMSADQVDFPK